MPEAPSREDLLAPQIACRILRPLFAVLRARFGDEFVSEVVREAGLELSDVERIDGWISNTFANRLGTAVALRLTGATSPPPYDHPVWRLWLEVGHATLRPEQIGAMHTVLRALGSPSGVYKQFPRLLNTENRILKATLLEHRPGYAVIETRERNSGAVDVPATCWNTRGGFEAIPTIWGLPLAEIEHQECRYQGADRCVYCIRFVDRSRWQSLSLVALPTAVGALGAALASTLSWPPALTFIAGAAATSAAQGWRRYTTERTLSVDESAGAHQLLHDTNHRYAELYARTERLHQTLRSNRQLMRYLPAAVGRMLTSGEGAEDLAGRCCEVSVLFVDIAGYSTLSERLEPREVVAFLNRYFNEMSEVVTNHAGTVIELTGDGMLVVFGAPATRPDHATAAVRCGLALHARLAQLNEAWQSEAAAALWRAGMPRIACRIGIHSGEVVAGNIGDMAARYAAKGVTWLAINSGAPGKQGHGVERNQRSLGEYKLSHPILIDEDGKVGRIYGATNTPQLFVIGKDGTLLYGGGLDNLPFGEMRDEGKPRSHAEEALIDVLAGKPVRVPTSKPWGCSVKYG